MYVCTSQPFMYTLNINCCGHLIAAISYPKRYFFLPVELMIFLHSQILFNFLHVNNCVSEDK